MQIFHPIWFVDADGNNPAPYAQITAADIESGRWRPIPPSRRARRSRRTTPSASCSTTRAPRGRREVQPDHLAVPRDARRHRPRAGLVGRRGGLLPLGRALLAAELRGQGREPADRALLDLRAGGPGRPRRRADRERERSSHRTTARVRRSHHRRPGEKPLRRVDDRRPPGGRRRASARARPKDLPARRLHLSGRRGGRRLHGRSQRRVPPVRRRRDARRQVERTDGEAGPSSASCFR